MKKIILSTVFLGLLISLQAQSKFEVTDLGKFKLHSFITGNPLGDINYLIEGKTGLVILEPVAFYKDIEEFKTYIEKLGKPIVKVIANYHIAGFSAFDASKFVRIEGMPEFSEGSVYKGMMSNFAKVFKGEMDLTPYTKTALVSKNAKEKWAGVSFQFSEGVASDFPAASIIIGKKIYYTHFTPEKAHPSHLQIHDRKALDAVLSELQKVEKSGCSVVIGGARCCNCRHRNCEIRD